MKLVELAVEKKREQMVKTAIKKGLTSNETVRLSQELDEMLNVFIPPILETHDNIISRASKNK
jgi:hypothetical protein